MPSVPTLLVRCQAATAAWPTELGYVVGVSGGADSVALLLGLLDAGYRRLVVCHVNHLLRGADADADAAFVQALTEKLQLPFRGTRSPVAQMAEQRQESLESVGRQVRLAFFAKTCAEEGLEGVFLAHHADDVAETVLLHLFRGTAGKGLRGLEPEKVLTIFPEGNKAEVRLLRPLLAVRREEIRTWLTAMGQDWREDATNAQPIVARNRLRQELLPLAGDIFQRDVVPALLRMAESQRADEQFWESYLPDAWQQEKISTKELSALPVAVAQRVLVKWLQHTHSVPGISGNLVAGALGLIQMEYPASLNLPGKRRLRRSQGQLWVEEVKPLP